MSTYFKPGTWNVICDVCGRKHKSNEVRKRWDGLMVCPADWEARHPSDFFRARTEEQAVPFTRPEATDTFVAINFTAQPVETVDVTDTLSVDFASTLAETISFTESLVLGWNADLADTITITESVVARLIQPNPINAFALNVKPLG